MDEGPQGYGNDNVLNKFSDEEREEKLKTQPVYSEEENYMGENSEVSGNSDMRKIIYFGFNYPHNFIESVWGESSIANHLKGKFSNIYDKYGSRAAFFTFYTELDSENQRQLESYISNNYKG